MERQKQQATLAQLQETQRSLGGRNNASPEAGLRLGTGAAHAGFANDDEARAQVEAAHSHYSNGFGITEDEETVYGRPVEGLEQSYYNGRTSNFDEEQLALEAEPVFQSDSQRGAFQRNLSPTLVVTSDSNQNNTGQLTIEQLHLRIEACMAAIEKSQMSIETLRFRLGEEEEELQGENAVSLGSPNPAGSEASLLFLQTRRDVLRKMCLTELGRERFEELFETFRASNVGSDTDIQAMLEKCDVGERGFGSLFEQIDWMDKAMAAPIN